jgi:predicted ATP-grasp superfamily ATP-dependent carboligase
MREAIAGDLARIAGLTVTVAVSQQEAGHLAPVQSQCPAPPSAQSPAPLPAHFPAPLPARFPAVDRITALPDEGAVAFVRRQSRLHDLCWVVAPESGGLLASLQEAVGEARWIGCSGPAIRLASSKRATCAALDAAGILTPLAFATGHSGPWIVKPDDGAGTLDTRRHGTRAAAAADVARRQAALQPAVAEPFIAGAALSISLVVGPDLARPVAFNRQRLHIDDDGYLHDLGVQPAAIAPADPRASTLHSLAVQVAAALPGLRGFVGIDLVWNEREGPVVIEVNPRVTCAYVGLSAILQHNLAADILEVHPRSHVRPATGDGPA